MKKSNMKNAVSLEQIQKMIDNQSIKDARKELKKIIENDPYHTEAILMLARLLYQHMDDSKKEVIKLFKKALVMIEDNASLFNEFGLVQQQYGAHGKAIDLFREAIIHNANDGAIYHNLAYSLLQKGYIERARANYLQATLLDHKIQTDQLDELYGVIRSSKKAQLSETDPKPVLTDIKTILVTGSSSGIGRAIAMRFIEQGHRVIISGRRKEKLDDILNDLKTKDLAESVVAMSMDVTDLDSIQNGLRSLPNAFSEIDILINNAGLAKGKDPIHQGRFDHWNTMIDTNIKGILHDSSDQPGYGRT